ncbi:hypothetical protein [Pseudoneobacillus sp. C159]
MKLAKWFYLGALLFYIFSFLSAFSIGLYVLSTTIVLLFFGIALSLKLISSQAHFIKNFVISSVVLALAVVAWQQLISYVDDYYLFFPFLIFM